MKRYGLATVRRCQACPAYVVNVDGHTIAHHDHRDDAIAHARTIASNVLVRSDWSTTP